jgi:hypothetical protein
MLKAARALDLDDVKAAIAKATVTITKKGGMGVLVEGSLILTAAHCVEFDCEGRMGLGDYYLETVKTANSEFRLSPLAVEPVIDIAALGVIHDQELPKDDDKFQEFCEKTKPVRVCRTGGYPLFKSFPVHIYTPKGTWVTGRAEQWNEKVASLFVHANGRIEGGTSGGPIVNDLGELVAISSNFGGVEGAEEQDGTAGRPLLALPLWVSLILLGRKPRKRI